MHKKLLIILSGLLITTHYQNSFAHGGGGGTTSYEFDNRDYIAEREAKHQAAEKKQEQESWGDFMKAVKSNKTKKTSDKSNNKHPTDE